MSDTVSKEQVVASEVKLGGVQAWINWLLGVTFVVFVFTFQTGYAVTNVNMTQDLGLTVTQVGIIGSIYTWAFAVVQFGSGSILDKLGMRWVLPIACGIVTLGGFVFANASGPEMLILGQILMATGGSFGFVGAGFVGGKWFGAAKYGLMFCWVQFVASLAAIAGQKVLGSLVTELSWDYLLNGLAFCGLGLTVLMFIVMRSPQAHAEDETWPGLVPFVKSLIERINEVCAISDSWINALIGGATFGSMLALGVVWGPRFLMAGGMEQIDAFGVSSMMWLGLAFGAPVFGWISDKMKKRKLPMAIGCALQLLAIIYIILTPGMTVSTASIAFFLWGFMSGGSMLNFPIGAELVKPSLIGTSAAVVNAVQFVVGGIIMAIPGRVLAGTSLIARFADIDAERVVAAPTISDYQWALIIIPIALSVALFLFLFLRETYQSEDA